jgi:protein TonB
MKRMVTVGVVLFASAGSIFAQAPAQAPNRIRVGGQVMRAQLIHQVDPTYPREAKAAGVEGTVCLDVMIGKDGRVLNMKLLSGHPALAKAAMKAVSKWRYKPLLLKGVPVEVMTEVDINFKLAAN